MAFAATIARLILLEATGSRLHWLAAIFIATTFGLAQFLGQVALIEASHIQATIQGGILRVGAVFIVVAFVVTSLVRESSDKVTELLLSQAAPRYAYFAGKLSGYVVVAALLAMAFALPLLPYANAAGLASWTLSLFFELVLMASLSLFCVLSLTQILPAIAAALGFYLLARSLSAMQLIAAAASSNNASMSDKAINGIVEMIALFLPNIDQMTLSAWLVTAPDSTVVASLAVQAVIYTALLSAASLFDLYRKNL
jgi:hypothetical protein